MATSIDAWRKTGCVLKKTSIMISSVTESGRMDRMDRGDHAKAICSLKLGPLSTVVPPEF